MNRKIGLMIFFLGLLFVFGFAGSFTTTGNMIYFDWVKELFGIGDVVSDDEFWRLSEFEFNEIINDHYSSVGEVYEGELEPFVGGEDMFLVSSSLFDFQGGGVPDRSKKVKDHGVHIFRNDGFWWILFEIKISMFGINPTIGDYLDFLESARNLGMTAGENGVVIPIVGAPEWVVEKWLKTLYSLDNDGILKGSSKKASETFMPVTPGFFTFHNKAFLRKVVEEKGGNVILNILCSGGSKAGLGSAYAGKGDIKPDRSCESTTFMVAVSSFKGDENIRVDVDSDGVLLNSPFNGMSNCRISSMILIMPE